MHTLVKDKDINKVTASQASNDTFKAFVDAIIPRTPILAQIYGEIMFYGALDQEIDEYLVMNLDFESKEDPIVSLTTEILNQAAKRYMVEEGTEKIYQYYRINQKKRIRESVAFDKLPRRDRFRALSLLEQRDDYLSTEVLFQQYPRLISSMSLLVPLTMLGYYSEWYGYGNTRLLNPNQRVFEFAPISWQQVSYPGPSLSYIQQIREYIAIKESRNL